MKTQEEIISFKEGNFDIIINHFEEAAPCDCYQADVYTLEAAKKRKNKEDEDIDDVVDDDDYYNNDDEEKDNPFEKEPNENDLLGEDIPLEDDDDDLFDDEEDTYM
jgi:hypothetical protein